MSGYEEEQQAVSAFIMELLPVGAGMSETAIIRRATDQGFKERAVTACLRTLRNQRKIQPVGEMRYYKA